MAEEEEEEEEARAVRGRKGSIYLSYPILSYPTHCTVRGVGKPREYPCFIRTHGVDAWATTT